MYKMQKFEDYFDDKINEGLLDKVGKKNYSTDDLKPDAGKKFKNFIINYAYKDKRDKCFKSSGYGMGKDERDAGSEFKDYVMDERGFKDVKVISVRQVPASSNTGDAGQYFQKTHAPKPCSPEEYAAL